MDMREIMEQARAMQEKAMELQRAMADIEVDGQSGGGLVRITLTGSGVLKRTHIDPSLIAPGEREILEDLIVAAHADAKTELEVRLAEEMKTVAGKLGLPTGLGLG